MSTSSTASKKPTGDTYAALIARLQALGNSTRAEKEKAYQKSKWEHWGVALPKMDLAIREIPKDLSPQKLLALSARLWREPVWDLKIVAARIVARDAMPATEQLWKFVRARLPDLDWWFRELSKRNPTRVGQFLREHSVNLKSVARREASKYLDWKPNVSSRPSKQNQYNVAAAGQHRGALPRLRGRGEQS